MAALRGLRRMLCVLPLMATAACSGIGKGDKVEQVIMLDKSNTVAVQLATNATVETYLCLRKQLGIIAVFGKNGSADYSLRPGTTWTSDNENVVHVSNGNDIIPSNNPTAAVTYYPKGVLTPISPGVATITANYVGVSASVMVHVQSPTSIILSTSPFDTSSNASTLPPVSIGAGSIQQYYAYAFLPNANGQANVTAVQNVTGNAIWTILGDPNGTFASVTNPAAGTVVGGGLVTGVSTTDSLTVNAHFSACEGTAFGTLDFTAPLKVSRVASLKVLHDPNFISIANPGYVAPPPPAVANPPNPVLPLVVGTNEAFQAIATLDNGDTQDLSYQAIFSTTNNTGSANVLSFPSVGNIGIGVGAGTTQVYATFVAPGNTVDSRLTPLAVTTQNATLNTFAIAQADKNQGIAPQGFYQYHAQGKFVSASGGGSFLQDMTHGALWSSSNTATVLIGNAGMTFGIAESQTTNQSCVNITASSLFQNTDGSKNDSTILGVAGQPSFGCVQ